MMRPPSLPPPQRERREREAEGERGSPRIKAEIGKEEERTENGPAAQRQTSNFQVSAPGLVEGLRLGPANHRRAYYCVCEEDPDFFW